MRRYNIVFRILLILSAIDFALAAPVLVQERRQASVDMVHIPEDAVTVWGKRADDFNLLWEEYLRTWGKLKEPGESSAPPPSSGPTPSGPDHGPTNVVEAPQPNPASSTSNPDHSSTVVNAQPSDPGSPSALEYETMWQPSDRFRGWLNELQVPDPQLLEHPWESSASTSPGELQVPDPHLLYPGGSSASAWPGELQVPHPQLLEHPGGSSVSTWPGELQVPHPQLLE